MPNAVYGLYKNGQVFFDKLITVPDESKVMVVFLDSTPKHKLTDIFGLLGKWEDSKTSDEIINVLQTGKKNTQKTERKDLTFRTRLKCLARKTISYSKSLEMHKIKFSLEFNINHFGAF